MINFEKILIIDQNEKAFAFQFNSDEEKYNPENKSFNKLQKIRREKHLDNVNNF